MTNKLIIFRLILTIICNKYNLAPKDAILTSEFDDLEHKLMKTLHQKRANMSPKSDNLVHRE